MFIVGAGTAGLSAATELRRLGWTGRLVVVGEEQHRPYRRPPLSKEYLVAAAAPAVALPHTDEVEAEWCLGRRATALDVRRRILHVDGYGEAAFEGLVIATGVSPRPMPAHLAHPDVLALRTLEDAGVLRDRLAASTRVVILGAGFLGSEVAATARALGKSVTVIERASQPLREALGEQVGRLIGEVHRSHGVDLRLGVEATRLASRGRTLEVRLSDGTVLDSDLVVAALGCRPATGWLEGSGLPLDDGVLLDGHGLAAPAVAAAGDVARWRTPLLDDEFVRVEHHSNAVTQGRLAARSLMGVPAADIIPLPSFWSHLYDWRLQAVGFTGARFDFRLVHLDESGGLVGEYRDGDRLVGAVTNRRPRDLVRYREQLLDACRERRAASAPS